MLKLNFVEEKTSFDGKNFTCVPVFLDFPIAFRGFFDFPFLNSIKCFFPSLSI